MGRQSVTDAAVAEIDRQIADLVRAKDIILGASVKVDNAAQPKVRKPRKRKGLPTEPVPPSKRSGDE